MQWFSRLASARVPLAALGLSAGFLAWIPTDALALSAGCTSINAGALNQTGGSSIVPGPFGLESGEVITITWSGNNGIGGLEVTIDGVIVIAAPASLTGTFTYPVPVTKSYTFGGFLASSTNPVLTVTCASGANPQAAQRALFAANYFQFSPESFPGVPVGTDDTATVDVGHVFEFSGTGAVATPSVPWPDTATAYGQDEPVQNISASGQQQMMLGGVPTNAWVRVKGTLYSGTLGRSGGQGHGVFGTSFRVRDNVDVGVFGHILGGSIRSTTLNASMDSVIGGVGAYSMAHLENRVRLGISTSVSWGSHLLTAGGASGRFGTTHWTVDASVARPYDVGNLVITPMALMAFHHVTFAGYTDSAGTAVPSSTDSRLKIGALADIAYPMAIEGEMVKSVTPRFNVRVDFHALKSATVQISPTLALQSASVTVDLSTGVGVALQNGGNLDLSVGVDNLASTLVGYNIRGAFRMPLN